LPVTFDDTVARRRAVTYPDAFSTAPAAGPPDSAFTAVVFTATASTRVDHAHPATAITISAISTVIHSPRRLRPARAV
jgi:hypothetical protein